MTFLFWLLHLLLCLGHPLCVIRVDRRNYDGERCWSVGAGLYQQPETWTFIEVPR